MTEIDAVDCMGVGWEHFAIFCYMNDQEKFIKLRHILIDNIADDLLWPLTNSSSHFRKFRGRFPIFGIDEARHFKFGTHVDRGEY